MQIWELVHASSTYHDVLLLYFSQQISSQTRFAFCGHRICDVDSHKVRLWICCSILGNLENWEIVPSRSKPGMFACVHKPTGNRYRYSADFDPVRLEKMLENSQKQIQKKSQSYTKDMNIKNKNNTTAASSSSTTTTSSSNTRKKHRLMSNDSSSLA